MTKNPSMEIGNPSIVIALPIYLYNQPFYTCVLRSGYATTRLRTWFISHSMWFE